MNPEPEQPSETEFDPNDALEVRATQSGTFITPIPHCCVVRR
jgi:hypothetical protein